MVPNWKLSDVYDRFIIPLGTFAILGAVLYGLNQAVVNPRTHQVFAGSAEPMPAEGQEPEGLAAIRARMDGLLAPRYDLEQLLNERAKLEGLRTVGPAKLRSQTQLRIAETYLAECDILRYYHETGRADAGSVKALPGKIRSRARKGTTFTGHAPAGPRSTLVGALLKLYALRYVGDYHGAAPEIKEALEKVLKDSPQSRPARIVLGRFFFAVPTLAGGDLDAAVEYLKQVKDTEAGALWLARTYLAMGRPEAAMTHLRAAQKINKENPEVAAWIKTAKARKARDPIDRMRDMVLTGKQQYDPARVGRARDTFELHLAQAVDEKGGKRMDPAKVARLHYLIALSNLMECDILKLRRKQVEWVSDDEKEKILERTDLLIKEGLEHGDAAIAIDASVSEYHRVKGLLIVHRIRGMISGITQGPRAKEAVLKALELDEANPEAHEAIALMYYSNPPAFGGDVNRAIQELRTALKARARSATFSFLGKCYLKKERYERAILYFKKALSLSPRNLEAELFLAQAVTAKKEEEENSK